jgi:hypothetical protein
VILTALRTDTKVTFGFKQSSGIISEGRQVLELMRREQTMTTVIVRKLERSVDAMYRQQPDTPTLVGVELGACSARRFNSPYIETNAPHSAHTTG